MNSRQGPDHVVVDGSNIATEGRAMPSLAQLSEAVDSFMKEYPETAITVVVDATFGHRIDKQEVAEFEAGISNNELVAPPAGAVGRGDAFVLGIADKAGAAVLSNDSFQEFHGEYSWLFDEGRLIGGKPVPHVGWVWVDRVPVRGPVSRKATRGSGSSKKRSTGGRKRKTADATVRTGSKEASEPMPTPTSPPPGASSTSKRTGGAKKKKKDEEKKDEPKQPSPASESSTPATSGSGPTPVNDLMPFLDFVEHHPVGTSVNGTVDSYSSHGAYVTIGDSNVRGYIPLRLMADPPPRSARRVMKVGESITVVVVSYSPGRRSIDCALPDLAAAAIAEAADETDERDDVRPAPDGDVAAGTPTAAEGSDQDGAEPSAPATSASKSAAKKSAKKQTAAKKQATSKQATKKAAAKKAAATKRTAKQAAADKTAAERTAAKKTAAKKSPGTKSAAKKAASKKSTAKKAASKKTTAKKKAASKKAASRASTKQPAARKRTRKRAADTPTSSDGGGSAHGSGDAVADDPSAGQSDSSEE